MLQKQVVHPANLVFKLPDNVSLEEGVMCEPLSLVTILAARAFGAPKIIIADVDPCRLSIAKNLGADDTIQVSTNMQTMSTALNATWAGGKVCLVGLGHSQMTIPLVAAAREVDVIGLFRYQSTSSLCIELLWAGNVDLKPLITCRFRFTQEDIEKAFKRSAQGDNAIKVNIVSGSNHQNTI
ncbi:sorbitol dehydrogenase [Tanacetum coccineum]|uniref:Sorbitol dehydrogenase n=1 Tax=Tanacetum coccineum TaxID=301880 RepID=A0ABQ4ZRE5_9ASTR